MTTYAIDAENSITALGSQQACGRQTNFINPLSQNTQTKRQQPFKDGAPASTQPTSGAVDAPFQKYS